MTRRSLHALFATVTLLLCAGPAQAERATGSVDFTGVIRLSGCSASLVRLPTSKDSDKAVMLTNGHCVKEATMPGPGVVYVDKPSTQKMTLLAGTGPESLGTLKATRLIYATMTDTDMAIYELNVTYDEVRRMRGTPLTLADKRGPSGGPMAIASGYHKRIWNCTLDHYAHRLKEAGWEWKDSLAYNKGCTTIPGSSGSPVVDAETKEVIGVHNTGNESGGQCTMNNPCEINERGERFAEKGRSYGQHTWWITTCWTDGRLDLTKQDCLLPRPTR